MCIELILRKIISNVFYFYKYYNRIDLNKDQMTYNVIPAQTLVFKLKNKTADLKKKKFKEGIP